MFGPSLLWSAIAETESTMQWGYDSRIMQFFGPVGQGSIHDHANELNNDISQERSGPQQMFKPIIFFAHSLGGLVVKSVSRSRRASDQTERLIFATGFDPVIYGSRVGISHQGS